MRATRREMFQHDLRLMIAAANVSIEQKRGRLREEWGEVRDWPESEKKRLRDLIEYRRKQAERLRRSVRATMKEEGTK
ncbi:MAG: hypothetical protein WC683_04130 [bacterium]